MGMWTAIAVICIVGIVGGTISKRYEHKGSSEAGARLDELEQKMDRLDSDLRERVETLERIVTDRKEDLKRQFDSLDKAS
jgi:uncharacterized membrane-anchored protein YhcB (DUF1043 family)